MTAKGIASTLLLSLSLIGACSDDEDRASPSKPTGGGAGEPAGGNGSVGGNPPTLEGGASLGGSGSVDGEAGMSSADIGGGGAGGGNGNDNGGAAGSGDERLELCARFTQRALLANRFALTFDKAVYADPCVGWTTRLYEADKARDEHVDRLSTWSQGLWGCKDEGVNGFALVWEPPEVLTAGDAKRLIDYYLLVLDVELNSLSQAKLSPNESQQMRAALERLSQTMITDPSLDYSHPECLNPPGGEGGAGGAGNDAPLGGAGGEGGAVGPSSAGGEG